jgi:hypothetical protein
VLMLSTRDMELMAQELDAFQEVIYRMVRETKQLAREGVAKAVIHRLGELAQMLRGKPVTQC